MYVVFPPQTLYPWRKNLTTVWSRLFNFHVFDMSDNDNTGANTSEVRRSIQARGFVDACESVVGQRVVGAAKVRVSLLPFSVVQAGQHTW